MPAEQAIVRPHTDTDWDPIARIHNRARLDELRELGGVEAFLTLAQTATTSFSHTLGQLAYAAETLPNAIRSLQQAVLVLSAGSGPA